MAFTFGATKNAKDTDMNFEPLPAGNYEFEIEKVTVVAYPGNDDINKCNKLHIQLRTDLSDGNSRKVWDNIYMDENHDRSMTKLKKLVESCGIAIRDDADEFEVAKKLTDQLCNAEVYIHEYNGKKSNKVRQYIVSENKAEPKGIEVNPDDLPF